MLEQSKQANNNCDSELSALAAAPYATPFLNADKQKLVPLVQGWQTSEMMEMELESQRSVRITKRQPQYKTTGQSLWHVPLSARSELHSHPLAAQAQACGRLTKAERPEGAIAHIVTSGRYSWKKNCISHTSSLQWGHVAQGPCKSFKPVTTFLELCVSSLCRGQANILRIRDYIFRIVRNHANLLCIPSVAEKLDYQAGLLCEIRTFGRAVEGSNVSTLTNAMGGLSGTVVTHQEQLQLLHSSVPGPVPDSWRLFLPPALAALPSS